MASAFDYFGLKETTETAKFVKIFDTFFNCLNVRCFSKGDKCRKPNLKPYTEAADPRFNVS